MIDRATVERIIDAADIVDVVSDFVSLKKRGQNYLGLCPFHNDRRPSFNVSRTKGIYKCFACGAGGGVVNFVMEHEQMTYVEALRYLAKKYHIEIEERELTDAERMAENERESMLVVNEFALHFFEDQLTNTREGQEIGMSYFKERGFTQESIKKFHLGYSPEGRSALYDAAIKKGYNREVLFSVGLCIDDNKGGGYDRFRGRVMFPVFNIAGKVIAFGGRTLHDDKAKYVNSPESLIYTKGNEIYGLFQAKRAISKEEKCFIVEGYADVISMHQSGFENVIASSGTALTDGQIQKIHRFTQNVTELFDGDDAGVHAAMRGVDLLLRQGMNIKILLLPEGEDPDSFARSHASHEVKTYIDEHETDFISFKTNVLLKDCQDDPIKRGAAIREIVQSIALIPDQFIRMEFAKQCSNRFGYEEKVVMAEIGKQIQKNREKEYKDRRGAESGETTVPVGAGTDVPTVGPDRPHRPYKNNKKDFQALLDRYEGDLIRYVVKYGMCYLCDTEYDDGQSRPTTLVEYVKNELEADSMRFSNPVYQRIFDISVQLVPHFYESLEAKNVQEQEEMQRLLKQGIIEIQQKGVDSIDTATKLEEELTARLSSKVNEELQIFREQYLQKRLCSDVDDSVRNVALKLVEDLPALSRIHTEFGAVVVNEIDKLVPLVSKAIYAWKNAIVNKLRHEAQLKLENAGPEELAKLMKELQYLDGLRAKLASLIGDPVINLL